MAKIQSQQRTNEGGEGALCPYCRDTVSEGVIVECDQCKTRYHKECVTSCVILGCPGRLIKSESEGRELSIEAKEKPSTHGKKTTPGKASQGDSSGVLVFSVFFGVVAFGLTILLSASVGPGSGTTLIILLLVLGLILSFVMLLLFEDSSGSPK